MRRGAVVAMVTGLCLVAAGPAWAGVPGGNGRIAYTDISTATSVIHTVLPNGLDDRAIGEGFVPTWSPNGRRIAFGKDSDAGIYADIYTMRADGSDVRRLTFDGRNVPGG